LLYNYTFIFENISYARVQFHDLENSEEAQFIPLEFNLWNKNRKNPLNFLSHIHFSTKINKVIPLPFKSIWKNVVFDFNFKTTLDNAKPFCFIIHARCYEKFGNLLLSYLKTKFKGCVIIIYFTDLFINHQVVLNQKNNFFDLIFTTDEEDAITNGFIYCENPYSKIAIDSTLPKSDFFFIGKAKNRFKTIISLFELLTNNGFNCDFYITGVNKKEQIFKDRINYIKYMDYNEIVKHIISTQCIIELLQEKASSPTLRSLEAVCYNKRLLTNSKKIIQKDYYDPRYIMVFEKINAINIGFFKDNTESVDYNYTEKLSPLVTIKKIDENIQTYLETFPQMIK